MVSIADFRLDFEFFIKALILLFAIIFIAWRFSVALNGKKTSLHPFKKDFYRKLLADYYLWRSDFIAGWGFSNLHEKQYYFLNKSIKAFPTANAYSARAKCFKQFYKWSKHNQTSKENYINALSDVENAIKLEPEKSDYYYQYIHIRESIPGFGLNEATEDQLIHISKIIRKAYNFISSAGTKVNESISYYHIQAEINLKTGNYLSALENINKSIDIEYRITSCKTKIQILTHMGAYYEAIQELEKGVNVFGSSYFPNKDPLLETLSKMASFKETLIANNPQYLTSSLGLSELQRIPNEKKKTIPILSDLESCFVDIQRLQMVNEG
ncbi:MAG: hypothetical protein MRY83_25025 [Flavobacteriales bacterium]|nr:hypothetical protein [Flavobacteriales bacterium]